MPQTLLGLLGLVLATLVAFNQQRVAVQAQQQQLKEEYHLAASGVMMHVMEMIAARSFDEATTPEEIYNSGNACLTSVGQFTHRNNFGREAGCDLEVPAAIPECDDVDDVHGIRGQTVNARLPGGREIPFEVDVDVYYVDEDDLETVVPHRTHHKRVVLRARTPLLPTVNDLIEIERVIAYDPVKAEYEYEQEYPDDPIDC